MTGREDSAFRPDIGERLLARAREAAARGDWREAALFARGTIRVVLAAAAIAWAGCGNEGGGDDDAGIDVTPDLQDADTGLDVPADSTDAGDTSGDVPVDSADGADGADTDPDGDAPEAACPAAALGERLGRTELMVGGSMDDANFDLAPFDLRYQYMTGDVPEAPCADCRYDCFAGGLSCDNDFGCPWWGCWQWDEDPPGRFVADFLDRVRDAGAIPMITYYIWYSVAGDVEGAEEIAALQDGARLARFLADLRFLCEVMNEDPTITAILHLEPDLWGYGHQVSSDPETIPVALSSAGAGECTGLGDDLAGLAHCMLAIARANAPNVIVGFHASAWGAGADAIDNADPMLDLDAHADATAAYMEALGAGDADLVVVEMSDRDAGFNDRWWDDTNAAIPDFEQAISWVGRLGEQMELAPLWWQVPYGHMGLDDTWGYYRDNRVDYFFAHPAEFSAGGAIGIAFGAGADGMTTPQTDGGHFVEHANAYYSGSPPALCE